MVPVVDLRVSSSSDLYIGGLRLDLERRQAFRGDESLQLRPKAFALLLAFAQFPGEVLTRERLLELAWGYSEPGKTRTVDVHVNHLRGRLRDAGVAIETKRGVGYRLVETETYPPSPLP